MTRPRTTPRPHGSRWVNCRVCSTRITLNNLSTHLRNKHPETIGQPRTELYAEIDQPIERPRHLPAVVAPPPPAAVLPPLDPDDIVTAVVEQLTEGGMFPVAHLAAVFAWRDATTTFLQAVRT